MIHTTVKNNQKIQQKLKRVGLGRLFFIFAIILQSSLAIAQDKEAPAPAAEQGPVKTRQALSFNIGQNVLFGDWEKRYNDNISYGMQYVYDATPIFGFQFNFSYANHKGLGDDRLQLFAIEPDLRINFFYYDSIVLYGAGGFGFYPTSEKIGLSDGNVLAFGLNVTMGLDLLLGDHFTFGPGITFRSIFSKSDDGVHTAAHPNGMPIGGEYARLFIQAGYRF